MGEARPDCPFLSACADAFREATARATALRARLTPGQLAWKPGARTWSVVECIEHLNLTVAAQGDRMRFGILEGRSRGLTGGTPPYGQGTWAGRFVTRAVAGDRRVRTFKRFDPIHARLDADRVFERFRKTNQELVRLALEADGLDLGRIRVGSAPTGLFKMSLAQAFDVHARHHRRHLAQAESLCDLEAFPPS